jgi:hypothetical protein
MRIFQLIVFLVFTLICPSLYAQGNFEVRGRVLDAATGQGLPGVEVRFLTSVFITEENGDIAFQASAPAGSKLLVTLGKPGFQTREIILESNLGAVVNLGIIRMEAQDGIGQVNPEDLIPVITMSTNELGGEGEQNVASLLTSSNDIFLSLAAFNFSAARFRMRGYDAQYTEVWADLRRLIPGPRGSANKCGYPMH